MTRDESSPRIGNDDREAAEHALAEHLRAGRLQMIEYAERSAAAANAMTAEDLARLFADLPPPRPKLPGTSGSGLGRISRTRVAVIAAVGLVVVGVLVAVGLSGRNGAPAASAVASAPAVPSSPPIATSTSIAPTSSESSSGDTGSTTASSTALPTTATYLITNDAVDSDHIADGESDTGSYKVSGVAYGHAISMGVGCYNTDGGDYWLDYDLGRQWSNLTLTVGLRDDSPSAAQASYTVLIDSKIVSSGVLKLGTAVPLNLPIKDALRLRLKMNNPSTGGSSCSGNPRGTQVVWGDPQLVP